MPDADRFALFLAAASLLAVTPGPGLFYVAARALAGGRAEGVASSFGTGLGGMAHVFAARDRRLHRAVAVKVMAPSAGLASYPTARRAPAFLPAVGSHRSPGEDRGSH